MIWTNMEKKDESRKEKEAFIVVSDGKNIGLSDQ